MVQCDTIVEQNEEAIEAWFRGDQEKTLTDYLCAERVLTREEAGNNLICTVHTTISYEEARARGHTNQY